MSLIAKKKTSVQIPPLEASTYLAVCVGVIDIGEQKNETFNNYSQKMIFIFEIQSERVEVDGESKPRWLSETYTVSLNEKSNLAKMLISWRGKAFTEAETEGFDLTEMIGKPCQLQVLTVTKKDGTPCNRIAGVFGIPKGFHIPSPENPLLTYDIEDGENDTYKQLPEWIRDRIAKSTEWQSAHNGTEKLSFDEKPEPAPAGSAEPVRSGAIYRFANGRGLTISFTAVDSGGHKTQSVYLNCRKRQNRKVFAIKGVGGDGVPFTKPPSKVKIVVNGRVTDHAWLYTLGVDSGKATIMDSLKVQEPGAKYCHFPNGSDRGYDRTFFSGLLSEKLVVKTERGRTRWAWEKILGHERNEALDCRNYALAGFRILDPDLDSVEKRLQDLGESRGMIAEPVKPAAKTRVQRNNALSGGDW